MPIKIDAYHHADMKLNPKVVYVLSSNWTGYSKSQKEKKKDICHDHCQYDDHVSKIYWDIKKFFHDLIT